MKQFLIPLAIIGLSACAMDANSKGDQQNEAGEQTPDPRIGEAVDNICFQSGINGWKPVKGEDDVVLLEYGVRDWYRVELLGPCDESTLNFAQRIAIDSWPGSGCITRGDTIYVEDTSNFNRRCTITKIYKWDEDATAGDEEGSGAY